MRARRRHSVRGFMREIGIRLKHRAVWRLFARKAVWPFAAILSISGGIWLARAHQERPRVETKFTMGRIRYSTPMYGFGFGRRGGGRGGGGEPPWGHDWPNSEENFMKILAEVTRIDVNPGGHVISFDNEEVFKYPIAYLCEVGFLNLSEKEVANMREYLLRGGFLIVDDFRYDDALANFQYQMKRVFPDRSLEDLPRNHPIFTCFYDVSNLYMAPPPIYDRRLVPAYFGMFDDNRRLMMVVDYNNDISDYWEWSANPFYRVEDTNEAFKYGVNYVMYALTH
jgi:hypothetical protein